MSRRPVHAQTAYQAILQQQKQAAFNSQYGQYLNMTDAQLAALPPSVINQIAYAGMNAQVGFEPGSPGNQLYGKIASLAQTNPAVGQAYSQAYNTSAQVAQSHRASGLSATLGDIAPAAIAAGLTGGLGLPAALGVTGAIGTGAIVGGAAGLANSLHSGGNPLAGIAGGAAIGAGAGFLGSALSSGAPTTAGTAGTALAAPTTGLAGAASADITGTGAVTTALSDPLAAGAALGASSIPAGATSAAAGLSPSVFGAAGVGAAGTGAAGVDPSVMANFSPAGASPVGVGSGGMGSGISGGTSLSALGSLGSIAGAVAPLAGAYFGSQQPTITQLPGTTQAAGSALNAINAYPGLAQAYYGMQPQYANQAFQAAFNNPYAQTAQQSAVTAGQMASSAAPQAYGSGQSLLNAQNQILQSGMDPQQALYNQMLQQTQDQIRAGEAARGLSMSPIGQQIETSGLNQFNIDWQNQQLQRQIQATNAAGTAGRTGTGLQGVGAQFAQQAGQYPYTTAQGIAQNQFGAIGANQQSMAGALTPQQQQIQNYLGYVGQGQNAQLAGAQVGAQNALGGMYLGQQVASALPGITSAIGNLFPQSSGSSSSGIFPAIASGVSSLASLSGF